MTDFDFMLDCMGVEWYTDEQISVLEEVKKKTENGMASFNDFQFKCPIECEILLVFFRTGLVVATSYDSLLVAKIERLSRLGEEHLRDLYDYIKQNPNYRECIKEFHAKRI